MSNVSLIVSGAFVLLGAVLIAWDHRPIGQLIEQGQFSASAHYLFLAGLAIASIGVGFGVVSALVR